MCCSHPISTEATPDLLIPRQLQTCMLWSSSKLQIQKLQDINHPKVKRTHPTQSKRVLSCSAHCVSQFLKSQSLPKKRCPCPVVNLPLVTGLIRTLHHSSTRTQTSPRCLTRVRLKLLPRQPRQCHPSQWLLEIPFHRRDLRPAQIKPWSIALSILV